MTEANCNEFVGIMNSKTSLVKMLYHKRQIKICLHKLISFTWEKIDVQTS